jgi:AraC family transcriptional regulator
MKETTRDSYNGRLRRVQDFIRSHLDEELALSELAGVACFSLYHFHRVFTGMTGLTVMEYIRQLRLERAAGELAGTTRDVAGIAQSAGFATHEAFSRLFRSAYGMPPSRYRKACRDAGGIVLAPTRGFERNKPLFSGGEMEVEIKHLDAMRVAFVSHTGPYTESGQTWGRLCGNPAVQRELGPQTVSLGIYYDDPDVTAPERLRMDACVTVSEGYQPAGDVQVRLIEGGEYAVFTHRGSYDKLLDSYRWIYGQWFPQSGREPKKSFSFEIYRNSPDTTAPADLITEICIPL